MKLIFHIFLYFSTISLYANDNNKTLQTLVQELTVQNENLKKDLEITNKKFELLESRVTYKSDSLDNLARQIKVNEENFNKTFELFRLIVLIIGFAVIIIAILMGLYRNGQLADMKEEINNYIKVIKDNIQLHLDNFTLAENRRKTSFEGYEDEIKRLYHQADSDKNILETSLRESITDLDSKLLRIKKICCKEDSLLNIDTTNESKQNSKDNAKNLTDDLLE